MRPPRLNRLFCSRGHRRERDRRCHSCEMIREAARRSGDLFAAVEERYYRLGIIPRPMREHGLSEEQLAAAYSRPVAMAVAS